MSATEDGLGGRLELADPDSLNGAQRPEHSRRLITLTMISIGTPSRH
ncbi:MAG: hypothetical protein WB777_16175 [Mycobacterium sp.]